MMHLVLATVRALVWTTGTGTLWNLPPLYNQILPQVGA
jgi:hypothetical protein